MFKGLPHKDETNGSKSMAEDKLKIGQNIHYRNDL